MDISGIKGSPSMIGGAAMTINKLSVVVGSESGLVLRCFAHTKSTKHATKILSQGSIRWEQNATEILHRLPSHVQSKLYSHVEYWANGSRRHSVSAHDIFASKPKPHYIFPPPVGAVTEFDPHVKGPVSNHKISKPGVN